MLIKRRNFLDDFFGLGKQLDSDIRDWHDIWSHGDWLPVTDIYENEKAVTIEAELPGVDPDDVKITVEKDRLTIKGEMASETTKEKRDFFRAERRKGSFIRSFLLPTSVESEKILASYDKGVLTISIPKRPEEVPRIVDIKISR
jgi:HSP20 family protein